MINSVLIKYCLRNIIKIVNMNLVFEFMDYQAETSAKLSHIEIKKSIQQCKKTGLLFQQFLSLLHHNQFATDKNLKLDEINLID